MAAFASLDLALVRWINGYAHQHFLLDHGIVLISQGVLVKGGFLFAYLWWLWFSKNRKDNRLEVLRIFAGLIAALAVARMIQIFIPGRIRPIHDPAIGFVLPYGSEPHVMEHWGSFPSDHAVFLFAIATAIWMRWRLWGALAYLWVFVFGCLPRVYLGYHYPSDIAGGALLGSAIMALFYWLPLNGGASRAAARIFRFEQRHAAAFYTIAFLATYQLVVMFDTVRSWGEAADELTDIIKRAASINAPLEIVVLTGLAGTAAAVAIAVLLARNWLRTWRLARSPDLSRN